MNQIKSKEKVSKTIPVIRQTKASLYRLARNNPLLLRDNKLGNVDIPEAVTSTKKIERTGKSIDIAPVVPSRNNYDIKSVLDNTNRQNVKTEIKPKFCFAKKKPLNDQSKNVFIDNKKCELNNQHNSVLKKKEPQENNFKNNIVNIKVQKPRRSLSAQFFEKKKHVAVLEPEKEAIKAEITQSMENIADVSIIKSDKKTVKFSSPSSSVRKHLNSRRSLARFPVHSTPMITMNDLQRRLNDWLKKRGKSLSTFHHLKCFGVHGPVVRQEKVLDNDENKENIEENVDLIRSESYEALHIVDKSKQNGNEVEIQRLKRIVVEALQDLNKLILEGYPIDQCEDWVAAIRRKYCDIEDEPQYWECRASIERSRGNISCAVNCLTTALAKGAEIEKVDESLDQLFQKFSQLEINTPTSITAQDREMKILNKKCHIFKSTLIQFAVRDRELNKKEKQKEESMKKKMLVATPVRRSSRMSRSGYISTPGVKICDSLNDLEDSVKNDLCFKKNHYIQ